MHRFLLQFQNSFAISLDLSSITTVKQTKYGSLKCIKYGPVRPKNQMTQLVLQKTGPIFMVLGPFQFPPFSKVGASFRGGLLPMQAKHFITHPS